MLVTLQCVEKAVRKGQNTHTVREVCNQVLDLDIADLELAVEPAAPQSAGGTANMCVRGCAPLCECLLLDSNPLMLERRHVGLWASGLDGMRAKG